MRSSVSEKLEAANEGEMERKKKNVFLCCIDLLLQSKSFQEKEAKKSHNSNLRKIVG